MIFHHSGANFSQVFHTITAEYYDKLLLRLDEMLGPILLLIKVGQCITQQSAALSNTRTDEVPCVVVPPRGGGGAVGGAVLRLDPPPAPPVELQDSGRAGRGAGGGERAWSAEEPPAIPRPVLPCPAPGPAQSADKCFFRLCPPQPPPVDIADDIPTRGQGETRSKSLSAFDKTSLDILLMIIPSNEDRGHCVYDKVICPLEPPQPPPAEVEDMILKSAATRLLAEAPCVQLDPVLVVATSDTESIYLVLHCCDQGASKAIFLTSSYSDSSLF